MKRAVRIRLVLFGTIAALAAAGWTYTTVVDRAIDSRLNDEFAFAFDNHLATLREIASFARDHRIPAADALEKALGEPVRAATVASAARELITTLDAELDPEDSRLAHLIRRYDSEERALHRIHERFHQAGFGWAFNSARSKRRP